MCKDGVDARFDEDFEGATFCAAVLEIWCMGCGMKKGSFSASSANPPMFENTSKMEGRLEVVVVAGLVVVGVVVYMVAEIKGAVVVTGVVVVVYTTFVELVVGVTSSSNVVSATTHSALNNSTSRCIQKSSCCFPNNNHNNSATFISPRNFIPGRALLVTTIDLVQGPERTSTTSAIVEVSVAERMRWLRPKPHWGW